MRSIIITIVLILSFVLLSCDDNPTYNTYDDRMALVDITRDNPVLFETKLINTDIPDTTVSLLSSDFVPMFFWREIIGSGRKYAINAVYPDTNAFGEVPEATVAITDTIKINFHVIAKDTTANPDTLVRFTDSFIELGTVTGKMEKWGSRYDDRNGWLLMEISGAASRTPNLYNAVSALSFSSISLGNRVYTVKNINQTKSLNLIPNVIRNETITFTAQVIKSTDIVTFHVGKDNFTKVIPEYIGDYKFEADITAPNEKGYFHITVDVIQGSDIAEQGMYNFRRLSLLFYATDL